MADTGGLHGYRIMDLIYNSPVENLPEPDLHKYIYLKGGTISNRGQLDLIKVKTQMERTLTLAAA